MVEEFARLGDDVAEAAACQEAVLRLDRLDRLAPGDVAAVVRQCELVGRTLR